MAKIPFSIKFRPQIESGEYKVETNDHHSVRIICWNKNTGGLDRIVALVAGGSGQEKTLHYTEEGCCVSSGGNKNKDLFIITQEPELSEFEKAFLERVFHQKAEDLDEENREIFREDAHCVLELARKQLRQEIRAEALKDLPRWKKTDEELYLEHMLLVSEGDCVTAKRCGKVPKGALYLRVCDLLNLPGFNE